jgi:hypothetical protein
MGMVYYLNVSKRPIVASITSVSALGDGTYKFYENEIEYKPGNNELIYFKNAYETNGNYYDGKTRKNSCQESY